MGRRSDPIVLGGLAFGMGMTWTSFQVLGAVPSMIKYGTYWFCKPWREISQDPVGDVVWAGGFAHIYST
jgi:hypothetical protein